MPRNHSRYTWGQAGADIGTCEWCGQRKVLYAGRCVQCNQAAMKQAQKELRRMIYPNLDRIRELEGQ